MEEHTMPNLSEMVRVLYRHDWATIDQWASQFNQLADLTEIEVVELVREASQHAPRSRADSEAAFTTTDIA
jgi:hypothetical protein